MHLDSARDLIESHWSESVLATLEEYVAIPAKSPAFDKDWAERGEIERAVRLVESWCLSHAGAGWTVETVRLPGRTPVLWIDVPGNGSDRVLLYGHVDKQPEMEGWDSELGPWKPVLRGDRLYGRGGADDGYAAFASLLALRILEEQGVPHAPCGILIEACEESGSYDLPAYIDHLAPRIGTPSLVVCLDSGCGNYDQLWCTTSLRGLAGGTLHVNVLNEGVHSGDASGVVPSSFRVARALLARIEDAEDGRMLLPELYAEIPPGRLHEAARAAEVLGAGLHRRFPWQGRSGPVSTDETELVLNRTWRPFLEITGAAGVPDLERAGNVLRPSTALKLSIRLPPTCDASRARDALKARLEADPPHDVEVQFRSEAAVSGWNAPPSEPWLSEALDATSQTWFDGLPAVHMGEGGTIPFMGMLGEKFPEAQFVITGVLGPGSNAHGPNEFLHIPTAKRLSGCVAQLLEQHALRP
ncbi:MAG: M20/M25/M40 family metallo-hydrolase [Myxococcales bacterium]|nr:M20/M25/M40 family metallo-hydrolase [Myxococcales bacterium]